MVVRELQNLNQGEIYLNLCKNLDQAATKSEKLSLIHTFKMINANVLIVSSEVDNAKLLEIITDLRLPNSLNLAKIA
jgi:hypothetical protein